MKLEPVTGHLAMRRAHLDVVVATSDDDPDLAGVAEVLLVLTDPDGRRLCHPLDEASTLRLIEALADGRVEADKLNGRYAN